MLAACFSLFTIVNTHSAPEVYFGEKYSTKSDVFSIGVIIWETICRCLVGDYLRPYKEFKKIKIDYQIIIHSAKHGLRPTIPDSCPASWADLIRRCWVRSFVWCSVGGCTTTSAARLFDCGLC